MIKLVLTDMDDTLIPAGHDGASDYAIEGIHAMQAAGLHFGPVSGRQPSAMGWMFKNRSECFSTGAFCNGQVMFVDGEVVASRAIDNDALMRLADYLEQETDDTFLKVYSLGDDFWGNDAYCVTSNPERVRRAMESGGNAWLKGEEAPCRPVVDGAPVFKANIWSARSREELAELRERVAVEVPELSLVFPNNRVRLFDILPDGWDKGCAALELARALGLTPDEVAVFGDSDNDLPMIDAVPNSVAVANANEAVTAAARWHIGAAADDAVAGALHQIVACAATGEMPPFMRQMGTAVGSGIADSLGRPVMKLQQLRYVVKVAECGSITEASRRLFVSQPSITASIRDLENEMGVHIFERTNKGVIVSEEGETFLGYARQVLDQADLLEGKYKGASEQVPHFSVSCQHYSFAVNAFVDVIREFDAARYDFTLREEQTHEIIEDVAHMKSELGILYLSEHNREVIERMLVANELVFEGLFCATPHVFVCADHPLADRSSVTLEDLEDYPFLSYEQGSYNSFYYSEELTSTFERRKNIRVRDRATLFNLAMGLNGYTVCSGVISHELNGPGIISIPLDVDEYMEIGIITRKNTTLTRYGRAYIDAIRQHI